MDSIEWVLSMYLKAGILSWVIMYLGVLARLIYVIIKNDPLQAKDVVEEESTKGKKIAWPIKIAKIIIWPWGIVFFARNYSIFERNVMKEIEKRHTC